MANIYSNAPIVTVLMPVYNSEIYLEEAIDSILNQTFKNFELLIICETPTDDTKSLLEHYEKIDCRIRIYYQERQGLVASLNNGCELARGKYLARMDADDISLSMRLERQVNFMESHPDIGICGTWVKTIGDYKSRVWKYPIEDAKIRCSNFFNSSFAHPSVVIRSNLLPFLRGPYDTEYRHAEDYDLWVKCSQYTHFANLGEVLLLYRRHSNNVSAYHKKEQQQAADKVRLNQLLQLGIRPSDEEFNLHRSISSYRFYAKKDYVEHVESWLIKVKSANAKMNFYPEREFSEVISHYWFIVCNHAAELGFWTLTKFLKSPLRGNAELNRTRKAKFVLACMTKHHSNR